MPSTGKHVNANNQLEEEPDYANFSDTKNKHEKTNYEFRVGSLVVCYLSIIPLAHVYQMIIANGVRMIVSCKSTPKL